MAAPLPSPSVPHDKNTFLASRKNVWPKVAEWVGSSALLNLNGISSRVLPSYPLSSIPHPRGNYIESLVFPRFLTSPYFTQQTYLFDLPFVISTNIAAIRLWQQLGFEIAGTFARRISAS